MKTIDELIADEEEEVPQKTAKQLHKEAMELKAKEEFRQMLLGLNRDKLARELAHDESFRDQVMAIYDKLGYGEKWQLVEAGSRHERGMFQLLVELNDRRIRIIEDAIRGRDLRSDLLRAYHVETLGRMVKAQERNINNLTEDLLQTRDSILSEAGTFLKTAQLKGMQVRDELRVALHAASKEQVAADMVRRAEDDLVDFKEMCSQRFETWYADYEKLIMDKWVRFKEIFEDYKKKSEELRRKIYIAEDRFEKENKELNRLKNEKKKHDCRIEESKKEIDHGLQVHAEQMSREVWLLEERFKALQDVQKKGNEADKRNIDHLNKVTDHVIAELKNVKQLAEKVVRARRACDTYETQAEIIGDISKREFKETDSEFQKLDILEELTSKVQVQNIFMTAKIKAMRKENDQLKLKLKQVLLKMERLGDKFDLAGGVHQLV